LGEAPLADLFIKGARMRQGSKDGETTMAKRYIVRLSDEERKQLSELLGRKTLAAKKRMRAHVLLKADASTDGPAWIDSRIAEAFDVSVVTVEKIRKSYVLDGFQAAIERKKQCRPSRQPVLDGAKEARLVALCCGTVPAGHGRWTLSLLADKLVELKIVQSVARETVRQALKKTNCSLGVG
jgi:transposase